METQHDLQTLIARKLEGTITPEERAVLDALVAGSQEATQEYEMLGKIWETSKKLNVSNGIPKDERWNRLQSGITIETPAGKSRKMIWLGYAAAAAVFVIVAVVYLTRNGGWVTIKTGPGEIVSTLLPDSSVVKLTGNTSLSYDASEWSSNRNVRLQGEAFFEVRKNGISFEVESSNARIAVLGTSFNVNSSGEQTVVTCFTGKVSVASKNSGHEVILTRGLETVVNGDRVSIPYKAGGDQVGGSLNFNNAPLGTVFESLAHYHGRNIDVPDGLDSASFTGDLGGASLESALKTVCLSAGLEFVITADSVFIKAP